MGRFCEGFLFVFRDFLEGGCGWLGFGFGKEGGKELERGSRSIVGL